MTIRHLKVFIAVAQTGKMGAAAKELYISQPTVSQVISEIEEQYGVKLFERLSKKLYITKEGRQLLDYARHIIALFDEMERNLSYASTPFCSAPYITFYNEMFSLKRSRAYTLTALFFPHQDVYKRQA